MYQYPRKYHSTRRFRLCQKFLFHLFRRYYYYQKFRVNQPNRMFRDYRPAHLFHYSQKSLKSHGCR